MNTRRCLFALTSILSLAVAVAAVAPAQVLRGTSGPPPSDYIPSDRPSYSAATDAIAFDKAGNKYVSGNSYDFTGSYSYLAKFGKDGNLLWIAPADAADILAADDSGSVFALTKIFDDGTNLNFYEIAKYDGSNGNYLNSYGEGSGSWFDSVVVTDMVIGKDGGPIISGSQIYQYNYYDNIPKSTYPVIIKWDAGLYNDGWINPMNGSSDGIVTSLTVDTNGDVYFAGERTPPSPSMSYERNAFIGVCSSDFLQVKVSDFDNPGADDHFDAITLDPVTKVAVASGSSSATNGPIMGTFYLQSGSPTPQTTFTSLTGYPGGSHASNLAASEAGEIGMVIDTPVNGPDRTRVVGFTPNPIMPWVLTQDWTVPIGTASPSDGHQIWDFAANKDGFVLGLLSDSVPEMLPAHQRAFQLFTFSNDGDKIDRQVFDHHDINIQPPSAHRFRSSGGKMVLYGDFASFYPNPVIAVELDVQHVDGPDDRYETSVDTNLDVDIPHGVLRNDGNQFVLSPLSAGLVFSSTGIQVLNLQTDGSFHATFTPGFTGVTGFDYNLIQDGNVIGLHHVTIRVKKPVGTPIAVDDDFTVTKGSAPQAMDVLSNDTDPEGKPLKIVSVTSSANAEIKLLIGGKYIKFKPKKQFVGDVTFDYTIRDKQGIESTAHVVVHVV